MDTMVDGPVDRQSRSRSRAFFSMARGFWSGGSARRAWLLTVVVLAFAFAQIAAQVGINTWNRLFFDALERKDIAAVGTTVGLLPVLLAVAAFTMSGLVVSRMLLQVRWREWVTNKLAGWWIADQRYYRLGFLAQEHSAPEFRIAEDVRISTEPLVEFAIGLISAAVTAMTFAAILWTVAGSITFEVGGVRIFIPAYMAIAAVVYAVVASLAAYFVGRALVGKVAAKNETEALFRAEMTRLRENAESIALIKGDADERASVRDTYRNVVKAWMAVVRRQGYLALVLNTNGALFPIVPLLLAAPKYLSGELSLGAVMQVAAAFSAVQAALIWFVDNFVRLSEWYASVVRVDEFAQTLEEVDIGAIMEDEQQIKLGESDDDAIHIDNLSLAHRNGRVVIDAASIRIEPGEKVLIAGESGTGKSTLIRALAGLWPWGSGSIAFPKNVRYAFVPQKPYMPRGTLKEVLLYPESDAPVPDDTVRAAMERCGLDYMVRRLGDEDDWDRVLSGGERQRVAFCRLLINKPPIIIMDEATAALDEGSQDSLLALFENELAGSTLISVGHRPGLEAFHTRKVTLIRRPAGAHMQSSRIRKPWWKVLRNTQSA
ncbi:ABC transporter ATP-binding protein/permease [Phreatobacter cathodiphilus]|uniref:ABC transporter ATP-binding protein n=1 Tax=Phreatobacter cathodiphilus TaxID=1868589 RepID=A0A2S0NGB2_9HYPH|nr:ABC transporter ATP-binding protein/permease [Phreatobacter cathodiphilus]AVO47195.1 ABC transporter ATP-binding protein [Phreatobacter cathodiphilus]